MKTAKIALPLSLLSLVGIIASILLFGKIAAAPDGEELSFGFTYIFLIIINYIPILLFIPLGIGIFVCEICLFFARNKLATLKAALVLMCLLLPVMLFVAVYSLAALLQFSSVIAAMLVLSLLLYIGALIAVFISYFKTRHQLKTA